MPSRLVRTVRSDRFTVTMNRDFDGVLEGCSEPQPDRPRTWINTRIRVLYRKLYDRRHCHSLEVYEGDTLVGGLYGVTLGGAFFGESMFHRARDASKVALVHLMARLKAGGFKLLDTQFVTDHLRIFGAIEVPRPAVSQAPGDSAQRRWRLRRAGHQAAGDRSAGACGACRRSLGVTRGASQVSIHGAI
jgi:leucyl/phenylalanyl-tRNA--protein transferase